LPPYAQRTGRKRALRAADRSSRYPTVTVCIPTCARPEALSATLESWRLGTWFPAEIRVADSSLDDRTREVCERDWHPLHVTYKRSPVQSAAMQRNLAAEGCETDLVIFCDDDVELPPTALEDLLQVFADDAEERIGGIAGTIEGLYHRVPGKWLRRYYHLQAGYAHEHYGGRFFGPAINIFPTDDPGDPLLYRSEWLNTGLVAYRTHLFAQHRFPSFHGYSFQEDVNLSARVGRTHELYFHRGIRYVHEPVPAAHKSDARKLGTMQTAHRWYDATQLLGLTGFQRACKFLIGLSFDAIYLVRARPGGWPQQLVGSCAALWALAVRGEDPLTLAERAGS